MKTSDISSVNSGEVIAKAVDTPTPDDVRKLAVTATGLSAVGGALAASVVFTEVEPETQPVIVDVDGPGSENDIFCDFNDVVGNREISEVTLNDYEYTDLMADEEYIGGYGTEDTPIV